MIGNQNRKYVFSVCFRLLIAIFIFASIGFSKVSSQEIVEDVIDDVMKKIYKDAAEEPFQCGVKLSVTADEDLQNQVNSYILREIRELPGVDIVRGNDFDQKIEIVAMQLTNKAGTVTGFCLSIIRLKSFKAKWINDFIVNFTSVSKYVRGDSYPLANFECFLSDLDSLTNYRTYTYYGEHSVLVGSMDDLKKTCVEFVADFDQEDIEPIRQQHEILREVNRKMYEEIK